MLKNLRAMRRQRGMTLVEMLLYIGIGALIIVGGVVLYQAAFSDTRTNDARRQILAMQANIRNLYANQAGFVDSNGVALSMQQLFDANAIPADMRGTTAANTRHALGGTVAVAPANSGGGANDRFTITFTQVPGEACIRLATMNTSVGGQGGFDGLRVNGTALMDAADTSPVTIAEATDACGRGTRVTMVWTLF